MNRQTVTKTEWLDARLALLEEEKALRRQMDAVAKRRRELPRTLVNKTYVFDGPHGKQTLADLFHPRSQLVVYHFMMGPGWKEGCPSCSFLADHLEGSAVHLAARDVALAMVSRAPYEEIREFQERMGWRLPWVSSFGTDFNFDYNVSFTPDEVAGGYMLYNYRRAPFPSTEGPGLSVFYRDSSNQVFHTYSTYARGSDVLLGAYNILDMTPLGRDEDGLGFTMSWVRHHDRYGTAGA